MSKDIHEKAALGFQKAVDAYDRGRPDYPKEALDFLLSTFQMGSSKVVLDVGSGTGKFTKLIVPSGARIIAVEPVEGMRKKFETLFPQIEVLNTTAENIPLDAESVDVILAAQAFHWFDAHKALVEFHRLLKPGGKLGLIWNARDESLSWVAELSKIIDPYEGNSPRYKTMNWRKAFENTALFTALQLKRFSNLQRGTEQMIVDRVASISFISALASHEQEYVLGQVRELVQAVLKVTKSPVIELPYRTDFYWCEKK